MEDLVLEDKVVELLQQAKTVHKVQVINGHKQGTLTQALRGEKVGTIIHS
jgi:molybdenum storage protein